jgi:hypothetical protein
MRAILVLVGLSLGQFAFGYSAAPPQSFAKATADGKHMLVMLRSKPAGDSRTPNLIESKYDRSGLYPVPKPGDKTPPVPVWACDWSADWPRDVLAANDAIHAVRVPDSDPGYRHWVLGIQNKRDGFPPKPANLESQPAVFLYKEGKLFKTLTFGEVFDCANLTAADCFMGPVVVLEQLDDAGGRVHLHVESERGSQYAAIDFRTGQVVIAGKVPPPDKCGNDGPSPSGLFEFLDEASGSDLPVGQRIGYGLLALLVAAVTGFGVFALVSIWRKRDTDGT